MYLISVIIPAYNSEQFIRTTIQSVKDQSYTNWELLVVDDRSEDNTVNIIQEYIENDKRIKLFRLPKNSGPARARNLGIKNAAGKYIAFLDADDHWLPDKLQTQIDFMEQEPCEISFTDYYLVYEHSQSIKQFRSLRSEVTYRNIVSFNYLACSTVMYNQEQLGKHYMPNIRNRQDWALWIKLIGISGKALRVAEPLTNYLIRKDSISSRKFNLVKYHWYIYRSFLGFSLLKSLVFLGRNIFMHLKNKRK